MRSFVDERGERWEVAVGKESYGNLVLLFTSGDRIRRLVLAATSRLEAEGELVSLSEVELRARLASAEWWR